MHMTGSAGRGSGLAVRPTPETYEALQRAYEHLRWRLFDEDLPDCLITLQRRARSYGYFSGNRFRRSDGRKTDEIALNPSHFLDRPLDEVLATLAHEMAHLWQHHRGKPGRGRYHNREWAEKMKAIGLQPSDSGAQGGRETGDQMHHLIVRDGLFARAAAELRERGYVIPWSERVPVGEKSGPGPSSGHKGKSGKRVKYSCPACNLNAWAKHGAKLLCGEDMSVMAPECEPASPG